MIAVFIGQQDPTFLEYSLTKKTTMLKPTLIFTVVALLAANSMAQKEPEKEDILGGRQLVELVSRDGARLVIGDSKGEKLEFVADTESDTLWNRVVDGKLEPAGEAKWAIDLGDLGVKQVIYSLSGVIEKDQTTLINSALFIVASKSSQKPALPNQKPSEWVYTSSNYPLRTRTIISVVVRPKRIRILFGWSVNPMLIVSNGLSGRANGMDLAST